MLALPIALLLALGAATPAVQAADPPASSDICAELGSPLQTVPVLPTQFVVPAQLSANCIAWQQFIAVNWQADPQRPGYPDTSVAWSDFGVPGNANPTVWMSYKSTASIFGGDADRAADGTPVLRALSKLGDTELTSIGQAQDNKWLTSQAGNLTYYDVRLNPDEVDYILKGNPSGVPMTYAKSQQNCAKQTYGFHLPSGYGNDRTCAGFSQTFGSDQGTIEIKAAWVALPDDPSLSQRYLTMTAQTEDPVTHALSTHLMGLVGLHIIRKLPGADQFLWSTFEQIDNDPDYNGGSPVAPNLPNGRKPSTYTYYNPACDPATDHYGCQFNKLPGTPCTAENQTDCDPYGAPMQIARLAPVPDSSNTVTGIVWSMLPQGSVFNYYRLINVQWPAQSAPVPPGARVPLSGGDIRPPDSQVNVANTTLETYLQNLSCMDCHQNAPLADAAAAARGRRQVTLFGIEGDGAKPASDLAPYAADYSFAFVNATKQ